MARPGPPRHPDRVIAPETKPARGVAGDANALWRFERHRRRNRLAKPGPHAVALVLDHLRADFNVPKIFRSAEAFGAHAVHLVGIGPFDPAPAKGAFKHVPAYFHDEMETCLRILIEDGFVPIALDPHAATTLAEMELPLRCAFVVGHEVKGLGAALRAHEGVKLARIPQSGRIDSLNVAVAASVALYEYVRQRASIEPA